jgi:D-lactate dehydrogenase
MKSIKIAFFDTKPYDKDFFTEVNAQYGFDIKFLESHLNADTAVLTEGCDAVCVFVNDIISADIINILTRHKIRLIALRCAGYNNIDLKAAFQKISIVRVPRYSPYAVAEHSIAMMLTLNRKTHRAYWRTRDNNFSLVGLLGFDMHQKTAGVIGVGQIGKVVIEILSGFGMRVIAYDIDKEQVIKTGCPFVELESLYKESDIITLHCPLSTDNVHLIDSRAIEKMKDGVMIINTGRGGLINTRDLIQGLKTKKIGAAGLDVYEEESDFFFEDLSLSFIPDDTLARLQTFPNVLITSHQAFFTKEALQNIASTTLQNIKNFFENKPLVHEVLYKGS